MHAHVSNSKAVDAQGVSFSFPSPRCELKKKKGEKGAFFGQAVATSRFHCEDGALANMTRCSQTALVPCRAACGWQGELSKRPWRSGLVPRSEMPRGPR